jgi:F0F1-type ATP synthase assembly protein I
MPAIPGTSLLRRALWADALASGALAALLLAAPALLAHLLRLPQSLLAGVGAFLLPYAAFVAWLAPRDRPPAGFVLAVVTGNALWVIASVVLLLAGGVTPSGLGYAFVLAQAVAVGVFAQMQFVGLRKAAAA